MSYSRNFGFRSTANVVRDGRCKSPAASTWKIGEPVTLNPSAPGELKQAVAGAATAGAGLAIFEHIQKPGVDPNLTVPLDFDWIPAKAYVQSVHGIGVKVWFKNTASKTLYDGRTVAAGGLLASSVVLSGLAIGAQLTPDGSGKFKVANGTTDGNWLTVASVNTTTGVVEATLNF